MSDFARILAWLRDPDTQRLASSRGVVSAAGFADLLEQELYAPMEQDDDDDVPRYGAWPGEGSE